MEVAITRAVIEQLLANEMVVKEIPYFRTINNSLKSKPNCSKCKQRQGIQDQARVFNSIKNNIQLLPQPYIKLIKKALQADSLVIYSLIAGGETKKITL